MPTPSDEALVLRVAQRDTTAFTLLYDRYARSVYWLATLMIGAHEAEEVLQDIFLRLWLRADQYTVGRGDFAAWFMTLARNHIRDTLRRRASQERLTIADELEQALATLPDETQPTAEQWTAEQEQHQRLVAALRTLPEAQRRAIWLAYYGGMSQSTIADHLNVPLGTVKKRIRLGLQKLRNLLHDYSTFWGSPRAMPLPPPTLRLDAADVETDELV
jgi:RNA polymerase sigma-70 factor (ECF subfamily)